MKVTLIFLLCVVFCWFCSVLGAKSCKRTNKKPWRYCEDACSSDSDCMDKKKCLCDGDCGMSCITPGLSCGEPPSISNGQKRKTGTGLGDTVTYSCTQPYQRRGPETRTCRGIGKWDGKKTRCRKFCKDPGDIPYGNRDKGRSDSSHRVGTSIRYWCFPGTQLVGSAVITCMKSGDWSDKTPNCSLPSCGKPVKPDNAIFLKPSMDKDTYSFNDVVIYKCEFGYYGIGSRMQTCLKGTWDSTTFQCLPKSCGDPGTPANGGRSGQVYTFKSKVFFSCDRGHIRVGPAFRQCQSNQKWSGVTPTCQPVDCGSLPTPKNGAKTEETKTTYQGRVSFRCVKKGHELKGSRVRVCQEDGRWDGTFTKCDPVECDDPGTPRFGGRNPDKDKYIYGDTVTYECKKNFTMSGGAQVIVCSETKTWTGKVPICLAPCGDPGTPKGGSRRDHDFTHGKQVRFSCPVNWQMEGSDTITCNNGRWDKQAPKCLDCVNPLTDTAIQSKAFPKLNGPSVWCYSDKQPFLQIKFDKPYRITGIAMKASARGWISRYTVSYKMAVGYKDVIGTGNKPMIFNGNRDGESVGKNRLNPPIVARRLRIRPLQPAHVSSCARIQLYGCSIPEDCLTVGSRVLVRNGSVFYQSGFVSQIDDVNNTATVEFPILKITSAHQIYRLSNSSKLSHGVTVNQTDQIADVNQDNIFLEAPPPRRLLIAGYQILVKESSHLFVLGNVTEVMETGANLYLRVRTENRKRYSGLECKETRVVGKPSSVCPA